MGQVAYCLIDEQEETSMAATAKRAVSSIPYEFLQCCAQALSVEASAPQTQFKCTAMV